MALSGFKYDPLPHVGGAADQVHTEGSLILRYDIRFAGFRGHCIRF